MDGWGPNVRWMSMNVVKTSARMVFALTVPGRTYVTARWDGVDLLAIKM